MGRKAEGAEKQLTKSDYLPKIQGGQSIGYFDKVPNASGAWIPKEN